MTVRVRAIVAAVGVLFGLAPLMACSDDDAAERAKPRDCRTSGLELDQVRPAASPREAVQDLLVVPGEAPGDSPLRVDEVVMLDDDRARVDVTLGRWEGGYEVAREDGGWVPVAGVSCGDLVECSDLVPPEGYATDAYYATLCFEQTD